MKSENAPNPLTGQTPEARRHLVAGARTYADMRAGLNVVYDTLKDRCRESDGAQEPVLHEVSELARIYADRLRNEFSEWSATASPLTTEDATPLYELLSSAVDERVRYVVLHANRSSTDPDARIVEFSMLVIEPNAMAHKLTTLVNPGVRLFDKNLQSYGLTKNDIEPCTRQYEKLAPLVDFFAQSPKTRMLVFTERERALIENEQARVGLPLAENAILPMNAKAKELGIKGNFATMADQFGIPLPASARSSDVLAGYCAVINEFLRNHPNLFEPKTLTRNKSRLQGTFDAVGSSPLKQAEKTPNIPFSFKAREQAQRERAEQERRTQEEAERADNHVARLARIGSKAVEDHRKKVEENRAAIGDMADFIDALMDKFGRDQVSVNYIRTHDGSLVIHDIEDVAKPIDEPPSPSASAP